MNRSNASVSSLGGRRCSITKRTASYVSGHHRHLLGIAVFALESSSHPVSTSIAVIGNIGWPTGRGAIRTLVAQTGNQRVLAEHCHRQHTCGVVPDECARSQFATVDEALLVGQEMLTQIDNPKALVFEPWLAAGRRCVRLFSGTAQRCGTARSRRPEDIVSRRVTIARQSTTPWMGGRVD